MHLLLSLQLALCLTLLFTAVTSQRSGSGTYIWPTVRSVTVPPPIQLSRRKMWEASASIGTPPQNITIEMDSGWDQLVVSTAFSPPPYPWPNRPYQIDNSTTAKRLTCADAAAEGIHCDSCDGPEEACSTLQFGIFSGPVYQWACDVVRIGTIEEFNFCFSLTNQTNFTGDFGFKVDTPMIGPAPYTTQLLPAMLEQGFIPKLLFSACVNSTSKVGWLQLGSMLLVDVINSSSFMSESMPATARSSKWHIDSSYVDRNSEPHAQPSILVSSPMQWMSHNVSAVWIGDYLVYDRSTMAPASPTPHAGVDTGTIVLRIPSTWLSTIVSYLLSECTNNPLVGLCPSEEFPILNNSTIFDGTQCYNLTDEQIHAYPDLTFQIDDMNPTEPPHLVVHPSTAYLFHDILLIELGLPNCDAPNARLVDFGFLPTDVDSMHVVLGESFYSHQVFATDWTQAPDGAQAFAPLVQCA